MGKIDLLAAVSGQRSAPICDFLDVTCSPVDSFMGALTDWLVLNGVRCTTFNDGTEAYTFERGILRLSSSSRFHRASASGAFIDSLRELGLFRDYVNILGTVKHKVTRLDVAVDVYTDAPIILSALEACYSDGTFSFGRKSLRTLTILTRRLSDNLPTGTWYAGYKSNSRLTAKVYDKQSELLSKHDIVSPPITRFELTFRKDFGASLWDVLNPVDIFYSYAGDLMKTDHIKHDDWSSRGVMPWVSCPVDNTMTIERFKRMMMYSPELRRYCAVAARSFGSTGEPVVLAALQSIIHDCINDSASLSAEGDSEA